MRTGPDLWTLPPRPGTLPPHPHPYLPPPPHPIGPPHPPSLTPQALERVKLKEGIRLVMSMSSDGNKFLQDTQPWVAVKTDPELCATIVAAGEGRGGGEGEGGLDTQPWMAVKTDLELCVLLLWR